WPVCLGVGLALAAVAADWPQFLGPARTGLSPEAGLLQSWPPNGPPELWATEDGPGISGPVVAGPWLLLFHRCCDNEVVACLDAATCKERWQTPYPPSYVDDYAKGDGPRSTPLVADQRVYTLGAEGQLSCLDLAGGKILWKRAL